LLLLLLLLLLTAVVTSYRAKVAGQKYVISPCDVGYAFPNHFCMPCKPHIRHQRHQFPTRSFQDR
jgi:hypothetical protein